MASNTDAYLEVGTKRMFAGAIDWPGWCRSGRDEAAALQALIDYGRRYKAALGRAAGALEPPNDASRLRVVERLQGGATTDFGAPGKEPQADRRPFQRAEARRQTTILRAAWAAFDRAAAQAAGAVLRKGPRGGGRELDAIIGHVLDAEGAYLSKLGGTYRKVASTPDTKAGMSALREAILEVLAWVARGEPPPRTPRTGSLWTPRYFVRRSAWHSLDHAWEIEDRAEAGG
jgi:hypothetical protein